MRLMGGTFAPACVGVLGVEEACGWRRGSDSSQAGERRRGGAGLAVTRQISGATGVSRTG